jgi:hypothetical protein
MTYIYTKAEVKINKITTEIPDQGINWYGKKDCFSNEDSDSTDEEDFSVDSEYNIFLGKGQKLYLKDIPQNIHEVKAFFTYPGLTNNSEDFWDRDDSSLPSEPYTLKECFYIDVHKPPPFTVPPDPANPCPLNKVDPAYYCVTNRNDDCDNNLFDYDSFDIVPLFYRKLLYAAASRWENFIDLNPIIRNLAKEKIDPNFCGIKLTEYSAADINLKKLGFWAACSPLLVAYTNVSKSKFNSLSFKLIINEDIECLWPKFTILNILTHELGHALGLIVKRKRALKSSEFPNALEAYKNITGINSTKLITNKSSSPFSADNHWSPNNIKFKNTIQPGFSNEIMLPTIDANNFLDQKLISLLSIKYLVDYNYIEKNPGSSEGVPAFVSQNNLENENIKLVLNLPDCDKFCVDSDNFNPKTQKVLGVFEAEADCNLFCSCDPPPPPPPDYYGVEYYGVKNIFGVTYNKYFFNGNNNLWQKYTN